jgi:hypothetical protein
MNDYTCYTNTFFLNTNNYKQTNKQTKDKHKKKSDTTFNKITGHIHI